MKVALCCIGRMENRYAVEYVEYYKTIGFDKIFIYDNNFNDEEYFEDVLKSYIDDGFIEITNYRDKEVCQLEAYQDCYNKHNKEYDWIAFFDFDEFLYIVNDGKIKDFLSNEKFKNFQTIHVNWMNYGDNDLVYYEDKPVQERFKVPLEYDLCMTYDFPENFHIKSIIKSGIDNFTWTVNTHIPSTSLKACDCNGIECKNSSFKPYNYDKCYLKHYYTKTIEEWLTHKYKRQYADRVHEKLNTNELINRFFKLNKKTEEKEKFIENYLKKINNNVDIFIGTYKAFTPPIQNNSYKIIVGNHKVEIDTPLEVINCKSDKILDDRFYSEIYMLDWISKNYNLGDYVGFCHYRKYFSFMDNIPNMDEVFKENDVIIGKPIRLLRNVREHYGRCHNIEDLNIIENVVKEKYQDYYDIFEKYMRQRMLITYNMFIMKKEDFLKYIKFVMGVLDEYIKIVGTDIEKRIEDNRERYLKNFSPNNTVEYQYRIGGYLAERLTGVFICKHFKKARCYNTKITEKKY